MAEVCVKDSESVTRRAAQRAWHRILYSFPGTPVRQALLRLGQDGILTLEPHKGALLAPATERDYLDWLKIRVELEGFAARQAALNASKRDVDALKAIFDGFDDDNLDEKTSEYAAANVEFHAAIMTLADNPLLERIWASFGHRGMIKTRTIQRLDRARQSLHEHLALIDAIERRDAECAQSLAREHVEGLLRQVPTTWRAAWARSFPTA